MTPQKHKNGSSGAALLPPRHQTHADALPEHTSAAARTPVGVLQYLHGKTPVPPRWYWSFPIITEHIQLGDKYDKVKKVYSISILYFDLGKGADYLYHGQTTFTGVHTGDTLQISTKEKDIIEMKTPEQVFPEYFLIRVNEFNKVATTPLEEWIDYLSSGNIKDDTTTPGLQEARHQLQYMQMPREEQLSYDHHINAIMMQNDVISTAQKEGRAEGRAEGIAIGEQRGIQKATLANAKAFIEKGIPRDIVQQTLGLTDEQMEEIKG